MKKLTMTKIILLGLLTSIFLFAVGCSTKKDPGEAFKNFSAQQLFERGEVAIAEGDYKTAVMFFETLDARYPFSPYSKQADLDSIYAYYKAGENASAAAAADRYLQLYPTSPQAEYALYMKGLANFDQDRGFLMRYMPIDEAQRDLGTQTESYNDFKLLVERYPQSRYAADARQRMVYLRNSLARHELAVAEYNLQRHAYIAAINRASEIIRNYPATPSTERALAILVEANRAVGLNQEANDALRVLKLNYPKSPEILKLEGKKPAKKSWLTYLSRN